MTSYLLVPHGVSDRSADVWLASIDEDPGPVLQFTVGTRQVRLEAAGWRQWEFGGRSIRYRLVAVPGLEPRTRYGLELRSGETVVARGAVTTVPTDLPGVGEKPFTVLLGSCFCRNKDDAADVGRTFFHLPTDAAPDLKILCGDQVYLDSPWYSFTRPHEIATLQSLFVENYAATWTQEDGFRELLAEGATYFISDDHEFWNNAPTRGAYAIDTWTQGHRDAWLQAGRQLFEVFQTPAATSQLVVGPLSVFLADTRRNRDADRRGLMAEADFQRLRTWIGSLSAPGVLVVGQPIFDVQHGILGNILDWGLADYEQYRQLVRALTAAQHSIVVLTGDVHYGRVAHCALRSGAELIEVISSPLALVDKSAGGSWSPAPDTFPTMEVSDVVKTGVTTGPGFKVFQNHFLTLEFASGGSAAIHLAVKCWPIATNGETPHGTVVFERTLH